MTAKHTPGPWAWNENSLWGSPAVQPFHKDKTCKDCGHASSECGLAILGIATASLCRDVLIDKDEAWMPLEADKQLIAAAPDLLEALLCVLHDVEDLDMISSNEPGRNKGPWLIVTEAIYKAIGESK